MLPNDIRYLTEAYLSIYDSEENSFEEEMLSEETLLFEAIEELHDDEVEEIVEETIYDMLDEGYDFDEIEEIFEDIFSEAKVTTGRGGYTKLSTDKTSAPVSTGSGSRMAAQKRLSARKERKRAEAVDKVKGAVTGALSRVTHAARELVDRPSRRFAAKRGLIASKSGKSKLGTGEDGGKSGILQKQKTSAGRREVRGAVAKYLLSRAQEKIGGGIKRARAKGASAAVSTYAAGKMAKDAVTSAPGKAREAAASAAGRAREAGSEAISGVRRGIRGAALSVARSMREEYDAYDLVLEYLIDMGHAETVSEANYIMTQMDEQTIQDIIESQLQ